MKVSHVYISEVLHGGRIGRRGGGGRGGEGGGIQGRLMKERRKIIRGENRGREIYEARRENLAAQEKAEGRAHFNYDVLILFTY